MWDVLDKVKLVVEANESFPTSTISRVGRSKHQIKVLIEVLDNDKLVASKKDRLLVWNECRLGRFKHDRKINKSTRQW